MNNKTNCPNCGSPITLQGNKKKASSFTCQYCDTLLHAEPNFDNSLQDGVSGPPHSYWKIEISDAMNPEKNKIPTWLKIFFILPGVIFPLVILITNLTGHSILPLFSSEKIHCSGVEIITLLNRKLSLVEAEENCRIILNNVNIRSKSSAIRIKDNVSVTMINSRVISDDIAVSADDNAKISITNSTIKSSTTAFIARGESQISLSSCSAEGEKNLFIREKMAKFSIFHSSVKGKRVVK